MSTKLSTLLVICSLVFLVVGNYQPCDFPFLPMPQKCTVGRPATPIEVNPCDTLYKIKTPRSADIEELILHYHKTVFRCAARPRLQFGDPTNQVAGERHTNIILHIGIEQPDIKISTSVLSHESYKFSFAETNVATIEAQTYAAFVRGLQTFSQVFKCAFKRSGNNCTINNLPISIQDTPQFIYRGIMIDTSRHFLPMQLIFETIDAMMYNKMNVLHWHITDEDSFPLILDNHPEIAQYAAYSEAETYTTDEARQIVKYAKVRGIRVIPELDTPGHAASWGKAPANKDVACTFGRGYMGPLDVTLDKTYKLVKEVFQQIDDIFEDQIVHLGGDEVSLACLANRTQVEAEMRKLSTQNQGMELYYRKRQRKLIEEINPQKTAMYWMNTDPAGIRDNDIVHWWGGGLPRTNNKVVISNYGPHYLDLGVGNFLGSGYGSYINWMDFYNQNLFRDIQNYSNKNNVLGAEVCLWSEMSNQYTHHVKIWMRTSSFAERLWNNRVEQVKPMVMGRLAVQEARMNQRGIPTAPVTCQQCETHPEYC